MTISQSGVFVAPVRPVDTNDTWCTDVQVFATGTPNEYTVTAEAFDDTCDTIQYVFTAEGPGGAQLYAGPQLSPRTTFDMLPGNWVIRAYVYDHPWNWRLPLEDATYFETVINAPLR